MSIQGNELEVPSRSYPLRVNTSHMPLQSGLHSRPAEPKIIAKVGHSHLI